MNVYTDFNVSRSAQNRRIASQYNSLVYEILIICMIDSSEAEL